MTERESSPAREESAEKSAEETAEETANETSAAVAVAPDAAVAPADVFARVRETWGFPSFARHFPADRELATLVEAFAAGDYATVREGAPALAARTSDADVKRAAELLRARIEPDPTARIFFALTAALLVFLMAWWATHDGKQHQSASSPSAKPQPTVEIVK